MTDAATPTSNPTVASAVARVVDGDVSGAIALLRAQGDSAMDCFSEAVKQVYRQTHNIDAMLAIAEAATEAPVETDRLALMRLQFNAAANCWPGWGDDGVSLNNDQIGRGLDLARRSLALREKLGLTDGARGKGNWLVGALLFALGENDAATAAFERAAVLFTASGDETDVLMAKGYLALVAQRTGGADALPAILSALNERTDEDAKFFIDQLKTAQRILIDAAAP